MKKSDASSYSCVLRIEKSLNASTIDAEITK